MTGPCVICGATDYPPSMGGPTICPSCDCGDFGYAKVQRQGQEIVKLREERDHWKELARLAISNTRALEPKL